MSIFDNIRKINQVASKGVNAFETAKTAFSSFGSTAQKHPYQDMLGNPTTSRGREGYVQPEQQLTDDDDEGQFEQYPVVEREVSEALLNSFRKRATMKTDMIILRLQNRFLYQKVLAKIFIQNKGDDMIAKKYFDADEDEIDELSASIKKVLRNQKHLRAIENFKIDDYFKDSCIEFFTLEFEEDYRNGLMPDFKDINPVELLTLKMQEPFNRLLSDYAVDFALELKPKIIEGAAALKNKYIDKPKQEVAQSSLDSPTPEVITMPEPTPTAEKDVNDQWHEFEVARQSQLQEEHLDADENEQE